MADALWCALNIAHQVVSHLEAQPLDIDGVSTPDVDEVKQSITRARGCLVPFLSAPVTNPVFDVCVVGIRDALTRIRDEVLGAAASDTSTPSNTTPSSSTASSSTPSASSHSENSVSDDDDGQQHAFTLFRADFLLSQRCDQFVALFPSTGQCATAETLIKDRAGRGLWTTAFGNMALMVPWLSFQSSFESFLSIQFGENVETAKAFIDFAQDGFVSPFEFNAFLRWFGPLQGSFTRLSELTTAGVLAGFIPAFEANALLASEQPGTFLVRFSKTSEGAFALAFVDANRTVKHCLLFTRDDPPHRLYLHGVAREFENLQEFLAKSTGKLRHPRGVCWFGLPQDAANGLGSPTSSISSSSSGDAMVAEKSAVLGGMRTNMEKGTGEEAQGELESCIVCMDNAVNTVFLECGHLCCCTVCSAKMHKCPVCRQTISRVIPVFRT